MTATPLAEQAATRPDGALSTEDRLMKALMILTWQASTERAASSVTVAELCRVAGISRNALYRHHPSVLEALRQHRSTQRLQAQPMAHVSAQLRQENAVLRQKLSKLAALVDHYYAAYRETRSLLDRRERELAELRRKLDSQAISLRR